MIDLDADLKNRWLPSAEQMALADALLAAGYDQERGERRERGVYTAHLLVNKEYGFWTEGIELVFLDGVFLTRDAVFEFVHAEAEKYYRQHRTKLVGGWAWHPRVGEAAVWDDIMSQFPAKPSAFLVWEDDLAVAFRPVEDRAAAEKWLVANIDDRERFSATYCEVSGDGSTFAEHINVDYLDWPEEES